MEKQVRKPITDTLAPIVPKLVVRIRAKDGNPITLLPEEYKEFFAYFLVALATVLRPRETLVSRRQTVSQLEDNLRLCGGKYVLATNADEKLEQGIRDLLSAIASKNYQNLSSVCLRNLRKIAELATKRQHDYEFSTAGLAEVDHLRVGASYGFDLPEEEPMAFESEVFGRLVEIDKENLRIKLERSSGPILDLAVSAEIIDTLEQKQKMTKSIALIGTEYVRISDREMVDFKVEKLSPYDSDIPLSETFRKLRKIVGNQWDHLKTEEDIEAFVYELKSRA